MITLSAGDLIALTIALTSSIIVIITTAIANYRLTESRDYWRHQYHVVSDFYDYEGL